MNNRTDSYISQALIVTPQSHTMEHMVTKDDKQKFSERLNAVLDRAGAPAKGKGRQLYLAEQFGLSQKGVRKWLEGESIPSYERSLEIVKKFESTGVTGEWLFFDNNKYAPEWYLSTDETIARYETSRLYYLPLINLDIRKINEFLKLEAGATPDYFIKTPENFGESAFAIRIPVNGKAAIGNPGDYIVFDSDLEATVGRYVLIKFQDNISIMLYDSIGADLYLNPQIDGVAPIKITPELDYKILGSAVYWSKEGQAL